MTTAYKTRPKLDAARLIAENRGLIVKIAERYKRDGWEIDDLIQEGMLAALDAIKAFDPERGYKFSTYLGTCVRNRIWKLYQDYDVFGDIPEDQVAISPPEDTINQIRDAMKTLSARQQKILTKRFSLDGGKPEDVAEIAKSLRCSWEAVELELLKAFNRMQAKLQGEGE